jgi:hypothetical protein
MIMMMTTTIISIYIYTYLMIGIITKFKYNLLLRSSFFGGPQVQKGKFAISLSKGSEPQSLDSAKDPMDHLGKSWGNHG